VSSQQTSVSVEHGSVIEGDSLEILEQLPENEFHAIVCDPPYNFDGGIEQRDWDNIGSAEEYQEWCQEWATRALKSLKPGGHLIAFSGNRTHHRLFSGIEDAGYEIRDTINWIFATGIPKGQRIERWLDDEYKEQFGDWRSMLKPTTEYAVLARSPLDERSSTKNQMKHGTANLNVEACRLDGDDGRFPVNMILDPVMAELIDQQSGERQGCQPHAVDDSGSRNILDGGGFGATGKRMEGYADSGGASRFFYCPKASQSERTHDGRIENEHNTVKPLQMMRWLVRLVTSEGQKVLDPFAGSGSTIVAAEQESRECVGIEMDPDFAQIARDRFADVADQP